MLRIPPLRCQVISHQSAGGRFERRQEPSKMVAWNSIIDKCTIALQYISYLSRIAAQVHCFLLLHKFTYTQSIQLNLGLPRTRLALPSAINTILAIWYWSVLSTCLNLLITLIRSTAKTLSIPALLLTSSFLTLSIDSQPVTRNSTQDTQLDPLLALTSITRNANPLAAITNVCVFIFSRRK